MSKSVTTGAIGRGLARGAFSPARFVAVSVAVVLALAIMIVLVGSASAPAAPDMRIYEDFGMRHGPEYLRLPASVGGWSEQGYEDFGLRHGPEFLRLP